MIRRGISVLAAAAALSVAGTSAATDKFGADGQFILGADRLWGGSMYKGTVKAESAGVESEIEVTSTQFHLLFGGTDNPYAIPRVGFDYAIVGGFTVGGALGYLSKTGTSQTTKPTKGPEEDAPSEHAFVLAPRAGFILPLGDVFAFWPRAGVTFMTTGTKDSTTGTTPTTTEMSMTWFAVNVEPMFVLTPTPHFGITFGPVFDKSLTGSADRTVTPNPTPAAPKPDISFSDMSIGFASGFIGWF